MTAESLLVGGIRREIGEAGLEAYTQIKAVHMNLGNKLGQEVINPWSARKKKALLERGIASVSF